MLSIFKMEHRSAIKRHKMPIFITPCPNLENIILSGRRSQRTMLHDSISLKSSESVKMYSGLVVAGTFGVGSRD